jgi:hypothetical protein
MPQTLGNFTGDGVVDDLIDVDILLPDSGNAVTISGRVQRVGQAAQTVAPTVVNGPGVPGSGTNYWIIQVDWTSGAATAKSSAASMPAPDANNLVVFQQTLPSNASPDLAFDTSQTPDTW